MLAERLNFDSDLLSSAGRGCDSLNSLDSTFGLDEVATLFVR